jgi:hypothetical protein
MLERYTRKELVSKTSFLLARNIFKRNWDKQQIANAINEYLEKLGFNPYTCYCGASFNNEGEYREHHYACFDQVYQKASQNQEGKDQFMAFSAYFNFGIFHIPTELEVIEKERLAEEKLPSCNTCGEKVHIIDNFKERKFEIARCERCGSISIVDT